MLPGGKATARQLGDYDQQVKHLVIRFCQARLGHVFHSQLKGSCQQPNETLQEFEANIPRLVRLAYPTAPEDLMERLAVEAFADGLGDGETKQAVLFAHPNRLVDAPARELEFFGGRVATSEMLELWAAGSYPKPLQEGKRTRIFVEKLCRVGERLM